MNQRSFTRREVARTGKFMWVAKARLALWALVLIIGVFIGYGATPWHAIADLLMSRHLRTDQETLVAFASGYCFPAALGAAVAVILWGRRVLRSYPGIVWTGAIFVAASVLSQLTGLGFPAEFSGLAGDGGNPAFLVVDYSVGAYLNSYGISLFVTAAVIGSEIGLEALHGLERAGL